MGAGARGSINTLILRFLLDEVEVFSQMGSSSSMASTRYWLSLLFQNSQTEALECQDILAAHKQVDNTLRVTFAAMELAGHLSIGTTLATTKTSGSIAEDAMRPGLHWNLS